MRLAFATAAVLMLLAAPVLAATDPTKPTFWHVPNAPETPAEGSVRVVTSLMSGGGWKTLDGMIWEPPVGTPTVCAPLPAPAGGI